MRRYEKGQEVKLNYHSGLNPRLHGKYVIVEEDFHPSNFIRIKTFGVFYTIDRKCISSESHKDTLKDKTITINGNVWVEYKKPCTMNINGVDYIEVK